MSSTGIPASFASRFDVDLRIAVTLARANLLDTDTAYLDDLPLALISFCPGGNSRMYLTHLRLECQSFRVLQLYYAGIIPAMYQPALGIAFLRVQVNMRMTFSAQENKIIQPEGTGFI